MELWFGQKVQLRSGIWLSRWMPQYHYSAMASFEVESIVFGGLEDVAEPSLC